MARNLLTQKKIDNAKHKAKPYRLADGDGLYLWIAPAPSDVKSWQFRYTLVSEQGKPTQQTATLGKFSDAFGLAAARAAADRARTAANEGKHLTVEKRVVKAQRRASDSNTFKSVADAWIKRASRDRRWSKRTLDETRACLTNHVSALDGLPLSSITASVAAPMLGKINDAPDMQAKVRRRLRAIFDYGVEQGYIAGNPLPASERKHRNRKHHEAITDAAGLGEILRNMRQTKPSAGIQRANDLLAFTAQRISEIVGARWSEFELDGSWITVPDRYKPKASDRIRREDGVVYKFDSDAGNWSIPRERMKVRNPERGPHHVVPLPPLLLAALREWRKADGAGAEFVCKSPADRERPITATGVEKFYRDRLGLRDKHSPHSWRSAFSTLARNAGKSGDVVEKQLDHGVGDAVAAAYDRAHRLELRRELMTWYEGRLIAARDGADVVPLRKEGKR